MHLNLLFVAFFQENTSHILVYLFLILSDFNAGESCWSDSPGKLQGSHLRTSRGCASCPAAAEDPDLSALLEHLPMNNLQLRLLEMRQVSVCHIFKQRT